jgi:hypothetical protein
MIAALTIRRTCRVEPPSLHKKADAALQGSNFVRSLSFLPGDRLSLHALRNPAGGKDLEGRQISVTKVTEILFFISLHWLPMYHYQKFRSHLSQVRQALWFFRSMEAEQPRRLQSGIAGRNGVKESSCWTLS